MQRFEFLGVPKSKKNMKKSYILLVILLLSSFHIFATHNRAGEIVYEHVAGNTYKITIYVFTHTESLADRDSLEVQWGDNTMYQIPRIEKITLANQYYKNTYVGYHTYPGAGIYQIVMEDPNRNEGVLNIPNSVNTVFALSTVLKISPFVGINNTPVLYNYPIDKASLGQVFKHNPGAFDIDGDSISYKMAICRYDGGEEIIGFQLPPASTDITVNEITGDLVWNAPTQIGIYNVAMEIEEWRNGIKISSIIRDIQIEVEDADNNPPVVDSPAEICVVADSLIEFEITATDEDNDFVTLSTSGGVFELNNCPAELMDTVTGLGTITTNFIWQTCCSNIRTQPYNVIFKAQDDHPETQLTDYSTTNITVIGPATEIIDLEPSNSSILVQWLQNRCSNTTGYKIYRKKISDSNQPAECETGIPESWEYELIGTTNSRTDTTFLDNENGDGLALGFYYCYRIVTIFNNTIEGVTSEIECVELAEGAPIFLKNTVSTTDTEEGAIHLQWRKPINLDTTIIKPPFKYILYYSRDLYGTFYEGPINVLGLDNTSYIDTSINTKDNPSIYKLIFTNYDEDNNTWNEVGEPTYASSPFLSLSASNQQLTLKVEENVPWENESYVVYKLNNETSEFDSIGTSEINIYVDKNLKNGEEYCYKVKSINYYSADSLPDPIINFSQIACGVPIDTIPPCCPTPEVVSQCDDMRNRLSWSFSADSCYESLDKFKIYYTNRLDGEFELIETIDDPTVFSYYHYPETTLAACYKVSAVDSAGNESVCEETVCIDNCSYYDLPNIFTPNGDGVNDLYHPYPYKFVEKVDMKIYNRWGNLVFQTEDSDLNWDGKNIQTQQLVSDGVYYYICDVYEYRLTGLESRVISGFIHIYSKEEVGSP